MQPITSDRQPSEFSQLGKITLNVKRPNLVTKQLPPLASINTQRLPPLKQGVKPAPKKQSRDSSDDEEDEVSEDDETSEEGSFYVELILTCVDEEDNMEENSCVFNFVSRSNYQDHLDEGFDDIEKQFKDSIDVNYPGMTYANEWEEGEIYGETEPDHDGAIVTVEE